MRRQGRKKRGRRSRGNPWRGSAAALTTARIQSLVLQQDGRCAYCGQPMQPSTAAGDPKRATLDHFFPQKPKRRRRTSGSASHAPQAKETVVAACWRCNQEKGNQDPKRFVRKFCPPGAPIFDLYPDLRPPARAATANKRDD